MSNWPRGFDELPPLVKVTIADKFQSDTGQRAFDTDSECTQEFLVHLKLLGYKEDE